MDLAKIGGNMDERNETLVTRMEKLERSNRRLKLLAIVALALVSVGATQSQSKIPDVVQAKRFQVVGGGGKVLIDIGPFGANNHAAILIFDKKGVVRESIGIDASTDDSGVFSFDHNGTLRTTSLTNETGTFKGVSGHFVYDQTAALRTGINFDPVDDFTGFSAVDANGVSRVVAGTPIDANHEFVDLFDSNFVLRGTYGVDFDSTGGTGVAFADKNGVFRAVMQVDNAAVGGFGNEALFFLNPQNKVVGNFFSPVGQGGTFTANDANGTTVAHLP
jgi:hypothetical protein